MSAALRNGDEGAAEVLISSFERACERLAEPHRSVTEIAHACGFASSQHLATVFQRRLGVTPTDYRRERLS